MHLQGLVYICSDPTKNQDFLQKHLDFSNYLFLINSAEKYPQHIEKRFYPLIKYNIFALIVLLLLRLNSLNKVNYSFPKSSGNYFNN